MSNLCEDADYYAILGVAHDASIEDIKKRYKALVLKFHPDRESSAVANEAMVLITKAYETLSDPRKRSAYDAGLREQAEKPNRSENSQAKHAWTGLVDFLNYWKIPMIIAISISSVFLTGYQVEPWLGEAKAVSTQDMTANQEYFTAIIHEALLSLPLNIPVFGIAWGVLASFVAGFTDKAIITVVPSLPSKISGTVFYYSILAAFLKMCACYAGMCQSVELLGFIRKRSFTKLDRECAEGGIILVTVLSAVAGYVENVMANVR